MSNEIDISSKLESTIRYPIDDETRLVAAIAYGEASVEDCTEEIAGIAHAVANRAFAWKITVSEMIVKDRGYTYAANGKNVRFNMLRSASLEMINRSRLLRIAVNAAMQALRREGTDPSNGAYWWDGEDLKLLKIINPRIKYGFQYQSSSHNIFGVAEIARLRVIKEKIRNRVTGTDVESKELGRYEYVYISTAAHGRTIFWKYQDDFIKVTRAKDYR